jgi:hypothetical protein
MTNHHAACPKSLTLCDQLFEALQRKIPGLRIKYDDNLCSMWSTGAVIAWASPIMIWGGIRVWFIGESQNMKKFPTSTLPLKIKPILGMWGDSCASFQISNNAQIEAATELLFTISYPLSITWLSNDVEVLKGHRPPATVGQKTNAVQRITGIYTTLAARQL